MPIRTQGSDVIRIRHNGADVNSSQKFGGMNEIFQPPQLTAVVLSGLVFTGSGETMTLTLTGAEHAPFTLEVFDTTPTGWLDDTAISGGALTGSIPSSGSITRTLTVPGVTTTVNRTANIRATNSYDAINVINTGLFRQMHTVAVSNGNLTVDAESIIVGTTVTFSTNITAGDEPFTAQLYDVDPRVMTTAAALETITETGTPPQVVTFTGIDTTPLAAGDHTYYIRVTDNDNDIVVESETITIGVVDNFLYQPFTNYYGCDTDFHIIGYNPTTATNLQLSITGLDFEGEPFTQNESLTFRPNLPPRVYERGLDPGDDAQESSGSHTYTLTVVDGSFSPAVQLIQHTFINTVERATAFNQIEIGYGSYRSINRAFGIDTNSVYRITDSFIGASGIDSVTADVDTIPEGSNRVTQSGGSNDPQDININGGLFIGTHSVRGWISSVNPPTNAPGTIVYGPVTTFTIPIFYEFTRRTSVTNVIFIAGISSGVTTPTTLELFDVNPEVMTSATPIQTIVSNNAFQHQITFTAIDTAGFTAGDYIYYSRVTDSAGITQVLSNSFNIAATTEVVHFADFTNYYVGTGRVIYIDAGTFSFSTRDRVLHRTTINGVTNTTDSSFQTSTTPVRSISTAGALLNGLPDNTSVLYEIFNEETSPNTLLATDNFIFHNTNLTSFDETEVGVPFVLNGNGTTFRYRWNGEFASSAAAVAALGSGGFEYIVGDFDSVPTDGTQTINSSVGGFQQEQFSTNLSIPPGTTITIRGFVANGSDRTASGFLIKYGPVSTITTPIP